MTRAAPPTRGNDPGDVSVSPALESVAGVPVYLGPGAYRIQAAKYHDDPAERPSLSASMANVLLTRSPRHAWVNHPRLNPKFQREHSTDFDLGNAAHAVLLGDQVSVDVIQANDWRTNAAKEAREASWAAGRLPLLDRQYARAKAMASAAHVQLATHEVGDVFSGGTPEVTLIWKEGDTWCRCLLDYCPEPPEKAKAIYDYKMCSGSANPESLMNRLVGTGADLQAAWYRRGYRAVFGRDVAFRFVAQELDYPHALSVVELDAFSMSIADRKIEDALGLWRRCVAENRWPSYPSKVVSLELPGHHEHRVIERENRREEERAAGRDHFAEMMAWQAPEEVTL
jgi:hypothetical protein